MSILNNIYRTLFLVGVFFIPFNSFEGLSLLGEFRNESAVFFFLIGIFIMFSSSLFGYKIMLPAKNPYYQVVLIFLVWCLIATLFNSTTVVTNYFKQTGGVNRFIRQYISLILSSVVLFIFYWNVLRNLSFVEMLHSIRKVFFWSLLFASAYGFFEILIVYFNFNAARSIIYYFNYFPFLNVKVYGDRISSIAQEAPYLAIYLITIAGWMFSYILTEKGLKKFIPTFLVLILTFFSGSRTGLVVIFIQLLAFFTILLFNNKYRKYVYIFIGSGFVLLTVIVAVNSKAVIAEVEKKIESLDVRSNLTESVSNKSRIGIQAANIEVFKEHPLTGVGFGQQTYHNRFHYPIWATYKNYEFKLFYKDQYLESFPPGYNVYIRILAETGLIGITIFLFLLFALLRKSLELIIKGTDERKILAIVVFISFLGLFINWFQIDTFRLYGFWICLAIFILLKINHEPLEKAIIKKRLNESPE